MSITWNGVSSDTIGVIVERIPNRYVPTRRFSPQQVAGRNGNILLVDKSFPNVEQEYEVYLSAEAQGLPSVARACAEWLMGPDGYCRLEDSYDTTVYREAFLMGGYDLENILNKFGRCTITFSCKPQKYLLTGDTPIEIPAGITTYTGDVVQFDGVTGASITSLSTTISPSQDLHGYANPWPAGGGVNKLEINSAIAGTYNQCTFTVADDGTIRVSGTPTQQTRRALTTQTFSGMGTLVLSGTMPTGMRIFCRRIGGGSTSYPTLANGATLDTDTYTFDSFALEVNTTFDGTAVDLRLQIESGSSPTSWSPYSNICQISGRTGLSVYVGPTTAQADATTYAVDWTSEAGTVYGGTLDVVTGVLTVDRLCITPTADALQSINSYGIANFRCILPYAASTIDAEKRNSICSALKYQTTLASNTEEAGFLLSNSYALYIRLPQEIASTVADANAWVESNNVQYVYILATPLTYQLTAQEIEVLVGKNNVWTSSGPVSVTVEAPFVGIVTNPTPFEARPMLEVSGVGEITINGKTIQILESVSDFDIDCESMEAEDNSKIYCMDFPYLECGENEIVGDGSITALTVTPRWWTL